MGKLSYSQFSFRMATRAQLLNFWIGVYSFGLSLKEKKKVLCVLFAENSPNIVVAALGCPPVWIITGFCLVFGFFVLFCGIIAIFCVA